MEFGFLNNYRHWETRAHPYRTKRSFPFLVQGRGHFSHEIRIVDYAEPFEIQALIRSIKEIATSCYRSSAIYCWICASRWCWISSEVLYWWIMAITPSSLRFTSFCPSHTTTAALCIRHCEIELLDKIYVTFVGTLA